MIPDVIVASGNLPPGIHGATWAELCGRYGYNARRQWLLEGLRMAAVQLRDAGCSGLFVDGSFITAKEAPGDFDGCWDPNGVNPYLLDPVLLEFSHGRAAQKAKYRGELFVASVIDLMSGRTFLEFFQIDKNTGDPKGIINLDLGSL